MNGVVNFTSVPSTKKNSALREGFLVQVQEKSASMKSRNIMSPSRVSLLLPECKPYCTQCLIFLMLSKFMIYNIHSYLNITQSIRIIVYECRFSLVKIIYIFICKDRTEKSFSMSHNRLIIGRDLTDW